MEFNVFLASAISGHALDESKAKEFSRFFSSRPLDVLAAGRLAAGAGGARPFTCGIISAKSGHCTENCSFCAQSRYHASSASVYPVHPMLNRESLCRRAEQLAAAGVDYMGIVTSGIGPDDAECTALCEAAAFILARVPISLCASLGILSLGQAQALSESGFSSYHHNLETAESYYPQVCTTHSFGARLKTVENARRAGLRICSGGIFGLGESWGQRVELSVTLARLHVDSIPINFLTPVPGTPLESRPLLDPLEALGVIALFRLMHPGRDIVICGGRGNTLGELESLVFLAGANGLMVGDYLTTKGTALEKDMRLISTLVRAEKRARIGFPAEQP